MSQWRFSRTWTKRCCSHDCWLVVPGLFLILFFFFLLCFLFFFLCSHLGSGFLFMVIYKVTVLSEFLMEKKTQKWRNLLRTDVQPTEHCKSMVVSGSHWKSANLLWYCIVHDVEYWLISSLWVLDLLIYLSRLCFAPRAAPSGRGNRSRSLTDVIF